MIITIDFIRNSSNFLFVLLPIQAARRGMLVRRTAGRKIAMARAKTIAAAERAAADPSQVLGVK